MLEQLSLEEKSIIVTGGGTGLGREMVRHLARAGADLVIAARRWGSIQEAAEEVRTMGRRGVAVSTDVTDSAQANALVERTLEEFGKVDVLINNAGMLAELRVAPIWDISDEEWHQGMDSHLTGAFYCTRAVAKPMVERGRGKIVNVASGYGLRGGRDNYIYCCAKGGIVQLTRATTMSLARYGITCTALVPGYFPTQGTLGVQEVMPRGEFIPVGRVGKPQELGPVAVFLASEASDYMNGELFVVDGGALAGGYAPTGYGPEIPLPAERGVP